MIAPAEIKNLSSKVSSNQGTLKQKNSAVTGNANKINMSWKGEISEAYKDAAKKAQLKISRLISDLGSLKMKLDALANAVNRAAKEEASKAAIEAAKKAVK